MGLDVSHGAFSGAYSAFNLLRQLVCKAAGGSFPPHDVEDLRRLGVPDPEKEAVYRFDDNRVWLPDDVTSETRPGLYIFLGHSDCDGELTPDECRLVAAELESLAPLLPERAFPGPEVRGHLDGRGGPRACAIRFAEGCRRAADAGEPLAFR